jgi:hypothetical protein
MTRMKISSSTILGPVFASLLLLASTNSARADEPAAKAPAGAARTDGKATPAAKAPAKGKEVTLKGTLGCGKCSFKMTDACQNVLKVKEGGKEVAYFLAPNAVSEEHHEMVCSGTKEVTVKGTVSDEAKGAKGGKKILTASQITVD